jgi:hypothetical protein
MLPVRMICSEIPDKKQYSKKQPQDYPKDDFEQEVFRTVKRYLPSISSKKRNAYEGFSPARMLPVVWN